MTSIREVEVDSASIATYSSSTEPAVALEEGTTVRIAPMARQFGGWSDVHFHPHLRLPVGCPPSGGMVVTLEAMSSECVAIALSPEADFVLGKTYVVHFGSNGNVGTVIRRRLQSGHEAVDLQVASRVCSPKRWISYWVCLKQGGKLYCGVGSVPGLECIGILDDSLYNQLRSPVDAVKFVGLGNSALGRNARNIKVRNVTVTPVADSVKTSLESLDTENLPMINIDASDDDAETQKMMQDYEKECAKAKARAKKFGVPYKAPDPKAFLNWSKARRLRANPERGFATGMDIMSPEEKEKQQKRAERFGTDTKRDRGTDDEDGGGDNVVAMQEESLDIKEAWDNEKLTAPHRIDPPTSLWTNPPPPAASDETQGDSYSMAETAPPAFAPEKIHIFSVDWAAFKQIRTDDVLTYFSSYGPSYVEWLGELSCNVLFEDKFSAARALQSLSQQLPSPPPEDGMAVTATTASSVAESAAVEGPDAMSEPAAEGQEEDVMDATNVPQVEIPSEPHPDLGNMGWHFCHAAIRKVTNDRYGRRGTTARLLMRVATTDDVLVQRPEKHPAPPPGFSTKRVLGPGSDFGHRKKRRRLDNEETRGEVNCYGDGDHPLMSQGLSSSRDGYSLEQMESERAVDGKKGEDEANGVAAAAES